MKLLLVRISGLLLTVCSVSSCTVIGTLYPFYEDEKSFVIKDELPGKWEHPEDKKTVILIDQSFDKKQYKISIPDISDDGTADTTRFTGHLVNDNGTYFLEYWYELNEDINDFAVVRHFISKVAFTDKDKIEVSLIDPDKLVKYIDQKKLQLTYAKQKTGAESYSYLILDKTPVLQKAMNGIKRYPELFTDKITLTRSE